MANKAFKDFFLEPARKQLDEGSGAFLSQIEKSTKEVSGKKIKMPLVYGRSGGLGNRAETGDLPEANPRKWEQAEWETKNMYGTITISGKSIKASRNNKGAFTKMLTAQMEDLTNDANNDLRRQILGDGSGVLGSLQSATSSESVTLETGQNPFVFHVGQMVDIRATADDTVVESNLEVLNVDKNTGEVTLSTAVTVSEGDYLTIHDNYNQELTGVEKVMTKDNTLYGIDRSTNKWFNPNVENVDGEITEMVMQEAIDSAEIMVGSNIDFIMTTYGVARGFQLDQLSYKKNIDYKKLKGGYKVMSYADVPIAKEKFMKEGTMDFMQKKNWKLYHMNDWEWMKKDGNVLSRVSGKDAYTATLFRYADLGCDKPAGQTRLTGITEH
ncbi:MAG: phage major capsid protein [Bacillota bacterium]